MMDNRIAAALSKLDRGGWSLTVEGFARRALKLAHPLTGRQKEMLRRLMMDSGLPYRRVPGPTAGQALDVWDYEAGA